jgi:hypothetical protein
MIAGGGLEHDESQALIGHQLLPVSIVPCL